ncbi:bisdemethoxycurcumin synthase-like [Triticum dicoccoides]|uniref:bisdemethoxycurcumin synthase-like n=1 Tax=Triticum dicoccoides TaxID=85692 RepID=UPI00188F19AB|nr:bisdemethoxycurcumin synthase-like [Triticum dicoccoides]
MPMSSQETKMALLGNLTTGIRQIRQAQRADGPACVLAIGTANPANCVQQEEYADYYFRVTNSEHLTELKAKLNRICTKSAIKKRYFYHTEELLQGHPEFLDRTLPSLKARLDITATAVPELAAAAAAAAIAEWGRPAADITHLVVGTYASAHMPGADHRVASLLGLDPSVRTTMLYVNGCASACAALRVAKDIAENNRRARVLVACAELTLIMFRAPQEGHLDTIISQALLSDGAGAMIIGADLEGSEGSLFEMVAASQTVVPATAHAAVGQFGEEGFLFHPCIEMPAIVRQNVERCLVDALGPPGLSGRWNDLFWAVHPGGRAILDGVEEVLRLEPKKLAASRHVLSEYGNMSGVSIIFVLDELRRSHDEHRGLGLMLGIGPGLCLETMVLHACM